MRGAKVEMSIMFSYFPPEQRVPQGHPLQAIRAFVYRSRVELDSHFQSIYSAFGRPSIPPEHLLRVLLLQVFCGLRSESQMMEQLNYNLLFFWFVGRNWMPPSGCPRFSPRTGLESWITVSFRCFFHIFCASPDWERPDGNTYARNPGNQGKSSKTTQKRAAGYSRMRFFTIGEHHIFRFHGIFLQPLTLNSWIKFNSFYLEQTRWRGFL